MKFGRCIFLYSNGSIRQEQDYRIEPHLTEYAALHYPINLHETDIPQTPTEGRLVLHNFQLQRIKTSNGDEYFIYVEIR